MITNKSKRLLDYIKEKHGMATYSDIKDAGFDKKTLRSLANSGRVKKVSRALYRLSEGTDLSNPDFVTVSIKAPRGVVCLISALSFHEATDEIPRRVDVAIPRGAWASRIDYPPVHYYRFAKKAYEEGIEVHKIDGHTIRIYSLAKAIIDCFKFRSKIGMDIARNALKEAFAEKRVSAEELMRYAKICRVSKIVQPILETLL
jgi:predicted transcriptional regulator of viral defense system